MNGNKPRREISAVTVMLGFLLVASLSGCTFKNIRPELSSVPVEKYSCVVVGDIALDDKLWEYLIAHFRRGIVEGLNEEKAFATVYDSPPATAPESFLLVSGRITEVKKGSTALRWIVGFGAGKAKVAGTFEISDSKGVALARFQADESYAGGAGMGGANYLDMEDLMHRFGMTIGRKICEWSRSEKLDK